MSRAAGFLALLIATATVALGWAARRAAPLDVEIAGCHLSLAGAGEIGLVGAVLVAAALLCGRQRSSLAVRGVLPLLLVAALASWLVAPAWRNARPDRVEVAGAQPLVDPGRRTLLVAIDALTFERILPLAAAGRLPHLSGLMHDGAYGVLHSYRSVRRSGGKPGYWSPVVWTTIATGVTERVHGIDDFMVRRDGGRLRPIGAWRRKVPAFWNLFGTYGRPVGVVGWWATWPAEEIRGVMVSAQLGLRGARRAPGSLSQHDWIRRQRRLTSPEGYKNAVLDRIGLPEDTVEVFNREIFPIDRYPIRDGLERDALISALWQDRLYLAIAKDLLASRQFPLTAVYFEGIDVVSHQFWEFLSDPGRLAGQARFAVPAGFSEHAQAVDRYYALVDGWIGELTAAAGDGTTVIVCSDHGFRDDAKNRRGADHSRYGALLIRGEGIRAGLDLNLGLRGSLVDLFAGEMSVFDVLPTLMYLHGLPVSRELDGRVVYRAFEPSHLAAQSEARVTSYPPLAGDRDDPPEAPPAADAEYMDRLRALGYIE